MEVDGGSAIYYSHFGTQNKGEATSEIWPVATAEWKQEPDQLCSSS